MSSKRLSKKASPGSPPGAFLNIVGQNILQNELLLSFLKKETGLQGACIPKLESITQIDANESKSPQLLILDCKNIGLENLLADIGAWDGSNTCQCFFILCNVDPDSGIEKSAMDNGIQGIFYNNDPLELITKGICAILEGDLWYSRKALTNCIQGPETSCRSSIHPATVSLTFREKEILAYIASGYTNKAIADELSISTHTVKTHVYNVYRKINATNRLQASLWAAKFL
ncbi:MAG: response regulator transcription factor [Deltaproteobacteria bacterium]|nr:response regulator transcription factor [Deltaproteobacteria bacterium]